nr:zinc finger protein ZFAT-like [Maniola hyperantus]
MDIEELEIKIEYNESFESDPLREDGYVYQDNNRSYGSLMKTQENPRAWFQSKDSNGKLLCKYCELRYSTVQTLRHHVKKKHPEEAKALSKIIIYNKRNRKHACHICKKRFKDLADLKLHMTDHSMDLVETSCMHCNATFNKYEDLKEHIFMKHQKGNKTSYTCKTCGYRTLKKSHYQQHCNTHKENKALICKYCDYKTNYLPNLRIHERIHTNDKPYSCNFKTCDYRSAAKSALRSHQLKHYPKENMLFCDKCSYTTVYKQSLQKHLDSHLRNFVRIKR